MMEITDIGPLLDVLLYLIIALGVLFGVLSVYWLMRL